MPLQGNLSKDHPIDSFPYTSKSRFQAHPVALEAGQPYLFDLQGDFDTLLRLESGTKTLVFNDDIRADEFNSHLVFVPPEKGVYRAVVSSYLSWNFGAYTLAAQKVARDGPLTIFKDRLQTTDEKKKLKFFKIHKVQFTGGCACTIELESKDFDTFLVILDEKERRLAFNDDMVPGDTRRSRVDFTPKVDGTYLIVVTTFAPSKTGTYSLTVQRYRNLGIPNSP